MIQHLTVLEKVSLIFYTVSYELLVVQAEKCRKESYMRKKLHLKSILSMALAVCFMLGASTVCYAYDGNAVGAAESQVVDASVVNDTSGTPLPTIPDDTYLTRSGVINGPNYNTTTGYFGGSFSVPADCSGHLIRVHWNATPQAGANSSAVFKMTITGNGLSYTVYLPATGQTVPVSIGNLPQGTYRYDVSPHTNVSGSYVCVYQFYSY